MAVSFDLIRHAPYNAALQGTYAPLSLMNLRDSRQAKQLLVAQAIVTSALGLLGSLFGTRYGLSALLGAGIGTIGNALFAVWVFGRYRAQEPGMLVMRFYGAELAKLGLVLILLVSVFVWMEPLSVPTLLGAYFIVQLASAFFAGR
jgi:ATP synthase protein I